MTAWICLTRSIFDGVLPGKTNGTLSPMHQLTKVENENNASWCLRGSLSIALQYIQYVSQKGAILELLVGLNRFKPWDFPGMT